MNTIDDAYARFEDLHGGERPVRDRDDLRAAIHACGLRYEEIDGAFWDALFATDWAYDAAVDDAAVVAAYRD